MNNNFLKIQDKIWMKYALSLAYQSQCLGEVPVGAVLIFDNRIIGTGYNASITTHDPTAHAEIVALREGGKVLKNYRLINTTLYVTLEPCIMCLGAIIHSRVHRLVFGTKHDVNNTNKLYSTIDLLREMKNKNKIQIDESVSYQLCTNLIKNFFKNKRK